MGFPRQKYWSGLPFPPPGYLPHPGIESTSPSFAGGIFTTWETLRIDTKRQNTLASYVRSELKVIIEGENQIYSKWPLVSLTLIDHKDLLIQFVYNTPLWEMDISWPISKQSRSRSSAIAATSHGEHRGNSGCGNPGPRPQHLTCTSKERPQRARTPASSYTEMR